MGTPAYMSPEQASGRLDQLGPASDVYSLGSILYHILANRAPFDDKEAVLVIQKVTSGDFPRPRTIKAEIPKPLESICMKAMALSAGDRHNSPRLLANDIERWLASESVPCHRETFIEKSTRWMRRHRSWTLSGALAMLAITAVCVVAMLLISKANADAREALRRFYVLRDIGKLLILCDKLSLPSDQLRKNITNLLIDPQSIDSFAADAPPQGLEVFLKTIKSYSNARKKTSKSGKIERSDYQIAIQYCDKSIQDFPGWSLPLFFRAYIDMTLRDYGGARPYAQHLVRLEPEDATANILLGRCLYMLNEFRLGKDACEKATKLAPQSFDAWLCYADCLYGLEEYTQSLHAYGEAQKRAIKRKQFAEVLSESAYALRKLGRLSDAIKQLDIANTVDREYFPAKAHMVACLLLDRKYEEVILLATQLIPSAHPYWAGRLYNDRLVAYLAQERYEEANADAEKANRLLLEKKDLPVDKKAVLLANYAKALTGIGDLDGAAQKLDIAIGENPSGVRWYYARQMEVYLLDSNYKAVIDTAKKAKKEKNDYPGLVEFYAIVAKTIEGKDIQVDVDILENVLKDEVSPNWYWKWIFFKDWLDKASLKPVHRQEIQKWFSRVRHLGEE